MVSLGTPYTFGLHATLEFALLSLSLSGRAGGGCLGEGFPQGTVGFAWWAPGHRVQTLREQQQWQQLVQVVQAGELDAERFTEGSRKGQDKGPFVSMETAPQGEGLKEEKAPTSPPSGPGKWHLSWLGSPLPLPSLPGVHHGNLPSK